MPYVYILRSESHPEETYTGMTERLEERVIEHNNHDDSNAYTYRSRPWRLDACVRCETRRTAETVERFFKNASGKEKFQNFREENPYHPHHIQGFFDTLKENRGFGRGENRFKTTKDGKNQTVFVMNVSS